ncbi:MAG: ABC transporter ATP-binding protein [Cyclobacteriaceae bacterium]
MHIKIDHLTKTYPNGYKALNNVNLEIKNGMFGLLGPNGAGKSSLMRTLVTLQKHTSGSVTMDGKDISKDREAIRRMIGYLPQDFTFFSKLKVWEFLDYSARLSGVKGGKFRKNAVDEMLGKVALYEVRDKLANKLSGGMKRRLGIAQALIGSPKVLVIDEPTTGLDPEERIRFRNILSDLGKEDVIIILSTHIVGDISSTCEDMALLHQGKVEFNGSPELLIKQTEGKVWQITVNDAEFAKLKEQYPVIATIPAGGFWEIEFIADDPKGLNVEPVKPNLEHAYVYFMESKLNVSLN